MRAGNFHFIQSGNFFKISNNRLIDKYLIFYYYYPTSVRVAQLVRAEHS